MRPPAAATLSLLLLSAACAHDARSPAGASNREARGNDARPSDAGGLRESAERRGAALPVAASPAPWQPLFDGKSLGGFRPSGFGGDGPVRVEGGRLLLATGEPMTGITWAGAPLPHMNYELRVDAEKRAGDDFFCGLTFPVGDAFLTFVVGGWGGTVVGLSNLDDLDASENETTRLMNFTRGRVYRILVRVSPGRVQGFIDDALVVDIETTGRRLSLRPEVGASRPLGIAAWRTATAIEAIAVRPISPAAR